MDSNKNKAYFKIKFLLSEPFVQFCETRIKSFSSKERWSKNWDKKASTQNTKKLQSLCSVYLVNIAVQWSN